MNIKKRNNSNILFSLHDSKIIKMCAEAEQLSLTLDRVYEYNGDEEKWYSVTMRFKNIDYEECDVIVFDAELGYGAFTGTRYGMKDFIEKFPDAIFEIITETYGEYDTVFQGYIYTNGRVFSSGIINIWTTGDVVFVTESTNCMNENYEEI